MPDRPGEVHLHFADRYDHHFDVHRAPDMVAIFDCISFSNCSESLILVFVDQAICVQSIYGRFFGEAGCLGNVLRRILLRDMAGKSE